MAQALESSFLGEGKLFSFLELHKNISDFNFKRSGEFHGCFFLSRNTGVYIFNSRAQWISIEKIKENKDIQNCRDTSYFLDHSLLILKDDKFKSCPLSWKKFGILLALNYFQKKYVWLLFVNTGSKSLITR